MLQTALVRRLADPPPEVARWTLDAPLHERAVDVASGTLRLQGWLLQTRSGGTPQVLIRPAVVDARDDSGANGKSEGKADPKSAAGVPATRFPFNSGRPDVIKRVLGEPSAGHPQLMCGFSFALPLAALPVELGFALGDLPPFWALGIELRAGVQVIEGSGGWLFLDNDSNRSVDQYTGALRLEPPALRQWRGFLADCRGLVAAAGGRHAIVVAPSKEEVLRSRYPHPRAETTPLDQLRAVAQPQDHFVDAAAVLAAQPDPELLFKRTDTHWTDRGAMLATLAALAAMGFDADAARAHFAKDRYRIEAYAGDLGVKLVPVRSAPTEFLDAGAPEAGARFDNGLPNIGRVLVFEAPDAPFTDRLLMFGASSGYPMLKYLKRLFRRVVFVHSAGAVDPAVMAHERPGALLLQSNGRFLLQPPRADFSLRHAAAAKLREGGEPARRRAAEWVAAGPRSADEAPYFDMLRA